MAAEAGGNSPLRQFAHELRDALSPLAAAADLARLRGFDAESSRLLVEKVERALKRAAAVLDTFVAVRDEGALPASSGNAAGLGHATVVAGAQRVLIVDDNADVRRSYSQVLRVLGYTVTEAADAERALAALASDPPQIALIDVHLPRCNGYRLVQAIRARAGSSIFLVMLSGTGLDPVTRNLAREAGFDACLDKMAGPVALRELLDGAAAGR